MSLEMQFRTSKAVLWAASGVDRYGEVTVASPVEIMVRWNETKQDPNQAKDEVTSVPVEVVVDRDVAIGSVMRFGPLADLPSTPDNLFRVVNYSSTPDLKGRHYFRTASLVRRSDSLPTVV
jgi:hypothetical protein